MKLEVLLTLNINEASITPHTFTTTDSVKESIKEEDAIQGILLINNRAVKFLFNPKSMTGFLLTNCPKHRKVALSFIPMYVYLMM